MAGPFKSAKGARHPHPGGQTMGQVLVKGAACVGWDGVSVHLRAGDAWDADDPLVLAYPHLFTQTPVVHRSGPPSPEQRVERATRAPGEVRGGTWRGRK